jgi:RimJ/RimL family protein N-acetyltransferase
MIDPLLLDLPASIETPRLRMRPPQAGDGAVLLGALHESLPELRRCLASLPWVASEQTLHSAESFCRNAQANFLTRKDLPFLLFEKASGELVGACGLHRMVWTTPKAEVGYWVRTSKSGRGFVSEAVTALCAYAFEHLHAVRVELVTDEENEASRRVAHRCQFELEGVLRNERRAPDGSLRSTCIYARLAPASPQA